MPRRWWHVADSGPRHSERPAPRADELEVALGINPMVTLEKQLLNMIGNLV